MFHRDLINEPTPPPSHPHRGTQAQGAGLLLYENENDGFPPPLSPAAGIVWSRLDSVDGAGPIIDTDR